MIAACSASVSVGNEFIATTTGTGTRTLALALDIYAASQQNKAGDVGVMTLSQLGLALPNFWLAILLILLFAVHLEWVSAGGFPGWSEDDGGGVDGVGGAWGFLIAV